jgi:hypothetical protein
MASPGVTGAAAALTAAEARFLGELGQQLRADAIRCSTAAGSGFPEIEDRNGWHGRPLPADMASRAVAGRRRAQPARGQPQARTSRRAAAHRGQTGRPAALRGGSQGGDPQGLRGRAGRARRRPAGRGGLDGEVGNSTDAGQFGQAYPDRFFEMFIAEQQLVAAAVGLAVRGYVPFASTFAAFFSRAYDVLRMAGILGANIKLCGPHAGMEIGPDGPPRWRWRTWRHCARSTGPPCSTRPTPPVPWPWSRRWPPRRGSCTCALRGGLAGALPGR